MACTNGQWYALKRSAWLCLEYYQKSSSSTQTYSIIQLGILLVNITAEAFAVEEKSQFEARLIFNST